MLDVAAAGMKATYTFECAICGALDTQLWNVRIGDPPPKPSPPAGWRDVFGLLVCREHRIQADLYLDHPDAPADMPARRRTLWRIGLEL